MDIKITGLRPGEKLFEELLASGENTIPTYNKKIMIAKTEPLKVVQTIHAINGLCTRNMRIDHQNSVRLLKGLVPEYQSKNSIFEKLDNPFKQRVFKTSIQQRILMK